MIIKLIPWDTFIQCFFIKACPKTPTLSHSKISFMIQNPLFCVTTCPELWIGSVICNMRPTLSPIFAPLCLSNFIRSFPSINSTLHITGLSWSLSGMEWYSFPNECGLQGTTINHGQYLFIQSSVDTSRSLNYPWEYSKPCVYFRSLVFVFGHGIFWKTLVTSQDMVKFNSFYTKLIHVFISETSHTKIFGTTFVLAWSAWLVPAAFAAWLMCGIVDTCINHSLEKTLAGSHHPSSTFKLLWTCRAHQDECRGTHHTSWARQSIDSDPSWQLSKYGLFPMCEGNIY